MRVAGSTHSEPLNTSPDPDAISVPGDDMSYPLSPSAGSEDAPPIHDFITGKASSYISIDIQQPSLVFNTRKQPYSNVSTLIEPPYTRVSAPSFNMLKSPFILSTQEQPLYSDPLQDDLVYGPGWQAKELVCHVR